MILFASQPKPRHNSRHSPDFTHPGGLTVAYLASEFRDKMESLNYNPAAWHSKVGKALKNPHAPKPPRPPMRAPHVI